MKKQQKKVRSLQKSPFDLPGPSVLQTGQVRPVDARKGLLSRNAPHKYSRKGQQLSRGV